MSDTFLSSAIGNSYGDIYETFLEQAKGSRLNRGEKVLSSFKQHMFPVLKGTAAKL